MMKLGTLLLVIVVAAAWPAAAQDKPNSLGVIFDNISFQVPDFEANIDFWTKFGLERQPSNGMNRFAVFRCPNSVVNITVQEDMKTSGASEGTVINHFGFQVPDVPTAVAKWKAAGLRVAPGRIDQQAYLFTPDDVRIEILQDPAMTTWIKPHHIHFYVSDTQAAQAFYAKMFGAVPGKRGSFDAADVPNMNLSFSKASTPVVSTNGHPLNHIGFGVPEIEPFKSELEAKGVVFDPALQPAAANVPANVAFFLDPWGTLIELFRTDPPPPGR